jgi:serine/threonine-protein kinase RsbW
VTPLTADGAHVLADFTVASEPGNERQAMRALEAAVGGLDLAPDRLEQLKTAVAEATMNAIEHGNRNQPELDVHVQVLASADRLTVRITDHGADDLPVDPEVPDLAAKLEGLQTPRGWGLFLIRSMVDELIHSQSEAGHTVELVLHLTASKEADDGRDTV